MRRLFSICLASILGLSMSVCSVSSFAKTLKWAIMGQVEPIHIEMAKDFSKANNNWTVKTMSFANQSELLDLLLDQKPDVITMSTKLAVEYIDIQVLADLRPFYKGRNAFYNEVMTAFGRNFSRKGKTYALPFWGNLAVLNYNRDLFQAAGYPEPQPSWKYENEFYNALKKLTRDTNGDGKPEQWGMVGGVHNEWLPVFYSYGAEFLSMDGLKMLFTDKAAIDSLTYVQKLHQEKLVEVRDPDAEWEPSKAPFIDGRTAMFMDNRIWTSDAVKAQGSKKKMDVGYTSTPYGKKGNVSVASSQAIGMYVQAPNKAGAADFIKYLFDVDNQIRMYKEGGGFPTRKNVLKIARVGEKNKKPDALAQSYEKAKVMGSDNVSQMILDSVNYGIYEMVHLGWTPAQLIQQAKDEFYKMLKGKD